MLRPVSGQFPASAQHGAPAEALTQVSRAYHYSSSALPINLPGTAVNTVYPIYKRLGSIDMPGNNLALASVMLTSSLVCRVGVVGVLIAVDVGDVINITAAQGVLLSHVAFFNTDPAYVVPVSRSNQIAWGHDELFALPSGAKLSLYGCSQNDAVNTVVATLLATYLPDR